MASSPFHQAHHICIVVPDLDVAQAYLESVGIVDWREYDMSAYTDVSMSPEDWATLTYRTASIDNLQIQLCQPGDGDTPQRRFLNHRGAGVYHIGFSVGSVDEAETQGLKLGLKAGTRGRRADGTGFTYFDTDSALGVALEIRSPS